MIALLLTTALALGQSPISAVDNVFDVLDRRHSSVVLSTINVLALPSDDPLELSLQCFGRLTALQRELDTRTLGREMRFYANVVPEARQAAFEMARATAGAQSYQIEHEISELEYANADCQISPSFRAERIKTIELADEVLLVISTIFNQPNKKSSPVG